jgi:hypothetical protein
LFPENKKKDDYFHLYLRCVLADEAARRRLDSMHQRLRLLEQQMETLEAEVGKASSTSSRMDTYA